MHAPLMCTDSLTAQLLYFLNFNETVHDLKSLDGALSSRGLAVDQCCSCCALCIHDQLVHDSWWGME